jgi:hypothetical protein
MKTFRKVIIRLILVIFVLSTVGVVVLYLFNPTLEDSNISSSTGDNQVLSGDMYTGTQAGSQ